MKKIIWEKYVDPLGSNLDEVEFPGYGKSVSEQDDPNNERFDDDLFGKPYEDQDNNEPEPIHTINHMKVMNTPFGLLSLTEHALAANKFDFWILHTNFDITPEIEQAICEVPGVETCDVLTRYRARIGFPRSGLFVTSDVKMNIQQILTDNTRQYNVLIGTILDQKFGEYAKNIKDEIEKLCQNTKMFWHIYIFPNGRFESFESEDESVAKDREEIFKTLETMIGGKLLTYRDYDET